MWPQKNRKKRFYIYAMRNRDYVTVGCPSVRLSVCPVDRQQRRAAGLQLSIGASVQQQIRAASSLRPDVGVSTQTRLCSVVSGVA